MWMPGTRLIFSQNDGAGFLAEGAASKRILYVHRVDTVIVSSLLSTASCLNASVRSVAPRVNSFQTRAANARRPVPEAHPAASSRILAFTVAYASSLVPCRFSSMMSLLCNCSIIASKRLPQSSPQSATEVDRNCARGNGSTTLQQTVCQVARRFQAQGYLHHKQLSTRFLGSRQRLTCYGCEPLLQPHSRWETDARSHCWNRYVYLLTQ